MPKPAPVYDLELVFHPEHDTHYVHFERAAANPFQPNADGVPRVNVWWMADAALLSYWSQDAARPIFQRAGLQSAFLTNSGTDCYVAWQDAFVIVAFRGTQPDDLADILADANAVQVPWTKGRVHGGFAKALDVIWPQLSETLGTIASGRTVWFCGHSLGAALATLAGDRYPQTKGVCTFGSPRVGDPAFAAAFTAALANRCLRYVNDHDVVTHVPPPLLFPWRYEHVDPRRFIDPDGRISGGRAPTIEHFFEELIGTPQALLEMVRPFLAGSRRAPMFLLDHMPKAYAIWTWNDYEAHG